MKEMIYQSTRKIELLNSGEFYGFNYYILNLGTHPTAYVEIPKNHKLYELSYNEIYEKGFNIDCHGGLTFANECLYISETEKKDGWFIGWDYAHCYDYAGYEEMYSIGMQTNGKKWTTKEIKEDVLDVCKQLEALY